MADDLLTAVAFLSGTTLMCFLALELLVWLPDKVAACAALRSKLKVISLTSDFVIEGAREGKTVAKLMEEGGKIISEDECMDGISQMITDVQVEATFPDGTKLVTVHYPIRKKEIK